MRGRTPSLGELKASQVMKTYLQLEIGPFARVFTEAPTPSRPDLQHQSIDS